MTLAQIQVKKPVRDQINELAALRGITAGGVIRELLKEEYRAIVALEATD